MAAHDDLLVEHVGEAVGRLHGARSPAIGERGAIAGPRRRFQRQRRGHGDLAAVEPLHHQLPVGEVVGALVDEHALHDEHPDRDRERPADADSDRLFVVLKGRRRGRPLSPAGVDQILDSARARGIASLHVQHVGSDAALWRGNPFGVIGRLHAAAQEKEAIARAADVRFALDRMLSDETGHRGALDHQRLIAAGHSYGANTTLLTIGAQVVRNGHTIDCLDSRFSAAVVISAPPFYGETDLPAVLRNVSVPTMHVTATDDVIEIPGYHSDVADRLAIFDAVTSPRKLLAVFRGGSHSIFTDRTFTGGPSLNAKVKAATADLTLAFFAFVFENDSTALAHWRNHWQSILEPPRAIDLAPSMKAGTASVNL